MNRRVAACLALAFGMGVSGTGCQHLSPAALSEGKQGEIRAEVTRVADDFVAAMERLDADAAAGHLAESAEFRHADNEGHVMDFATGRRAMNAWFTAAASQKATPKRREVVVVSSDTALYIWQGSIQVNLADGSRLQAATYAVSALFKLIDGSWKIIFWQESGEIAPGPASGG